MTPGFLFRRGGGCSIFSTNAYLAYVNQNASINQKRNRNRVKSLAVWIRFCDLRFRIKIGFCIHRSPFITWRSTGRCREVKINLAAGTHFSGCCYNLRGDYILSLPKPKSTTCGLNSVRYIGPKLWNSIPNMFRNMTNFKSFKRSISQVYLVQFL